MTTESTQASATRKELRQFGFIFAGGLILFFGLLIPWIFDRPWPLWPWIGAGIFAGLSLLLPQALRPLNTAWLKIGHVLGWINTRIILGLVFFVIFMPVALILKLLGKDPMRRKIDESSISYRVESEHLPRERMEKPF